jgi:hypothetical protein
VLFLGRDGVEIARVDFRRLADQVCRSRFGSFAADVFRVWIGGAVDECHASFERFVAAFRRVLKGVCDGLQPLFRWNKTMPMQVF